MESSLKLPATARFNPYWIAAAILTFLVILFYFTNDWVRIFAFAFSIGIFPLLISNRLLLLYLTYLCFFMAETYYSSTFDNLTNFRWFFLAASVIAALTYPIVAPVKIQKFWKENKAVWIFSFLALASALYSVSPEFTVMRTFTLICIFYLTSRLVKPLAAVYGAQRIVDLIFLAILPLFVYSIFLLRDSSAWNETQNTFDALIANTERRKLGLPVVSEDLHRFHGIFQNPNTVGLIVALLFPVLLASALTYRKNKFYPVLMGIMLVFLWLSASRLGIVAVLASTLFVLIQYYGRNKVGKWLLALILPSVVAGAVFWFSRGGAKLLDYLRFDKKNVLFAGGRVEAWIFGQNLIAQRPWLGYGFGTEDQLFRRTAYHFKLHEGLYVHNSYIGLWIQMGALSLILFIPLFMLFFSELRTKNRSLLRIGLSGMLLSAFMACFFESWIYAAGNAFVLPFWSGVALLEFLRDKEKQEVQPSFTQ